MGATSWNPSQALWDGVPSSSTFWICTSIACLVPLFALACQLSWKSQHGARVGLAKRSAIPDSTALWIPQPFEYPRIEPCQEYGFETTLPLPYRPFRWGNYHITMAMRQEEWDEWIQLDNRFREYHRIKAHRLSIRGQQCVQTLPARDHVASGAEAAREAVQELSEYLCRRYPQVYEVKRAPPRANDYGWYGEGQIQLIIITPLNVAYDLEKEDPMMVAGMLRVFLLVNQVIKLIIPIFRVQDDLALMITGTDGKHYLQAGSILLPGSWRLEDKIGLSLGSIHTSGDVPQYKEKLEFSMDRFFTKLQLDKLIARNNYVLQVLYDCPSSETTVHATRKFDPHELAWSTSSLGDEEAFTVGHEPGDQPDRDTRSSLYIPLSNRNSPTAENLFFRAERQSLRRLPRTGAILFTIRAYLDPVTQLANEPGVPGRMASAIRSWPDDVAQYKGQHQYKDVLLEYLDGMHEQQVQQGRDQSSTRYPF
ncbi:hypothetical protein FRB95_003835 [Tulasnella sp. JGI-2019a]|nr:hypothetical protein FRB95_003835 [Tulasnella sp. JGI-2019a]